MEIASLVINAIGVTINVVSVYLAYKTIKRK